MYSKEYIERFGKIATASLSDACDSIVGRSCFMDYEMKARINNKKIVGPARTVLEGPACGEFVGPTHAIQVIDSLEEGEVLCIQLANGDKDVALFGGMMCAGCWSRGAAGAILDGGLRDVEEIVRDYDLQVYARSLSPATTLGRYKTLASDVPIVVGGVSVCPGDLIVADAVGVVCIPAANVDAVLAAAEEIEVKEALQAKLIVECKSMKAGLDKYNRI